MTDNIIYYMMAFFLALVLVLISKKVAIKFNIVDNPNGRKMHKNPKPLLGGMAVYFAIVITYAFSTHFQFDNKMATVLLLGFALVLIGLYDDYKDMRASHKLLCQIIIALLTSIAIGGISRIEAYGLYIELNEWQGILLETIWIIALINAFNLIDGLDGLSSGMGIISLTSLLVLTLITTDTTNITLIVIMIGALLAFLYYNFYPSTIFLGDSGSMFIGYMIAVLSINSYKTVTLTSMLLLFLIAFMPFLDVFLAIVRRKKNKKRAFEADSLHFHHRLLLKGYSHVTAVLILYAIMSFYALCAIWIQLLPQLRYKALILLLLGVLTIFIFERLYLLSDRYAYIHKSLRYIRYDILKMKRKPVQKRYIHKKINKRNKTK